MPESPHRILFATVIGMAVTLSSAMAEEYPEVHLRYATGFPAALYMTHPAQFLADELEKRSNGRITVAMHFSGSLGKSNEILDLVGKGAIDMGSVVQSYFTSALPFAAMTNSLPLTFTDGEALMRATMEMDAANDDQIAEYERRIPPWCTRSATRRIRRTRA